MSARNASGFGACTAEVGGGGPAHGAELRRVCARRRRRSAACARECALLWPIHRLTRPIGCDCMVLYGTLWYPIVLWGTLGYSTVLFGALPHPSASARLPRALQTSPHRPQCGGLLVRRQRLRSAGAFCVPVLGMIAPVEYQSTPTGPSSAGCTRPPSPTASPRSQSATSSPLPVPCSRPRPPARPPARPSVRPPAHAPLAPPLRRAHLRIGRRRSPRATSAASSACCALRYRGLRRCRDPRVHGSPCGGAEQLLPSGTKHGAAPARSLL